MYAKQDEDEERGGIAAAAALPKIPKELLDQFVTGPMTPRRCRTLDGVQEGADRARAGRELSHHLGYPPGAAKPEDSGNHRNGSSGKTVLTEDGPLRIEVPRDREGSFEPLLIPKHERRFTGFDDKIVAMYARGMTVREIQGFLAEQYGTEVSPGVHQLGHRRRDGRGRRAWQAGRWSRCTRWCSSTRCA
jgi:putative transposase